MGISGASGKQFFLGIFSFYFKKKMLSRLATMYMGLINKVDMVCLSPVR